MSQGAREAKLAECRRNQMRWMEERQQANEIKEVKGEVKQEAGRLRVELKEDLRKSQALTGKENIDLAASMENYLAGELMTHQCQICYELMAPPHHTPTLLFPCGHTFCNKCVERSKEGKEGKKGKCPYCRSPITSSAVNHSLKDLIERFADQKGKLEREEVDHLDDLFPKAESKKEGGRRGEGGHYLASYKSTAMREKILLNELDDSQKSLQNIVRRKIGVKSMKEILVKEREETERKRKEILEELALINHHLEEQGNKQERAEEEEEEVISQIELIRKTLDNVKGELEKTKMLALGSGVSLHELDTN
ncbi:hypothetical protein TrRE_jg1184 [Triparma retinervis]|uniref:RING-type domain-containing protein n=1 Tax=Triparma retinervis TaxID=2557542 RepID=A0A9W6ZHD9_9STRA|nr:hypothetical protein TrRE_jg1184 [Triparma retinervis]